VKVYKCDDVGISTMIIELTVDNENFKLIKLLGIPYITDSGILPSVNIQENVVLFIDIMNIGKTEGNFEIQPKTCCIESNCQVNNEIQFKKRF
jgi:hypothetical protein